jgi:hypothetical protein
MFSAHHVIAVDADPAWLRSLLDAEDTASPSTARFLHALSERLHGGPGYYDIVLAALGASGPPGLALHEVEPDPKHERVRLALKNRTDVRVLTTDDGAGLLCLGRGLAERWEASFEVEIEARGRGLGRQLAASALALVPEGEPLFVQVTPGNAASLRAVLAAGFQPIGSEVLFAKGDKRADSG